MLVARRKLEQEEKDNVTNDQPSSPKTPSRQQSLPLHALSTPTRATPKKSKAAELTEKKLRKQMSGALDPGIITYSIDEPSETSPDQTQPPSLLNSSVTSSPFICALVKIERWRAGLSVTFSEDEMARFHAFVDAVPERMNKKRTHSTTKNRDDNVEETTKKPTKKRTKRRRETTIDSTDSESFIDCELIQKVKRQHSHHSSDDEDSSWWEPESPKRQKQRKKTKKEILPAAVERDALADDSQEKADDTSLEQMLISEWKQLPSVNDAEGQVLDREAEWKKIYNNHTRIQARIPPPTVQQSDNPSLTTPFNQNQGPTRLRSFLAQVSVEDLANPLAYALPFSLETQENHRWVFRLLSDFGVAYKLDSVFPLQIKFVKEFIFVLGIHELVSVHSLDSTVRSAMIALDTVHRGEPTPYPVRKAIVDEISLLKKLKEIPDVQIGKPPLIASDLLKIIAHIPSSLPEKPFEASLFLFSLSTGARASTCAAIELRDIERIVCLKDTSVLLVTIRLRKMKGYHAQDSVVTLEGDLFAHSNLNVLYWLQQHLVQRFGLSLTAREEWEKHCSLEERIWPLGPDAMTIRLQNRAFQAGHPLQYFGFHSLRSGFISSALIKAGDDDRARTRVLEQTAIVARWVPYSPVQMQYVKKAAIGAHVANRLVMPDSELHSSNVMEPVLTSSEIFHNQKLDPIPWTGGELLETFNQHVTCVLGMLCALTGSGPNKLSTLRGRAARNYCSDESITKSNCEVHIQNSLMKDKTPLSMAQRFLSGVRDELAVQMDDVNSDGNVVIPCAAPKPIRKKKYWLEWERNALADGREAGKSWEEISQSISDRGGERTPDNCAMCWYARKRDMKKRLMNEEIPPEPQSNTDGKRGGRKSALVQHIDVVQESLAILEAEWEESE
ncbi:hypothetical protein BLNAU_18250 [Blattamonas nauphoetae]|uniref:Myb-like domain-containing protein n=1 Tax=Blattamonas nauphoetae TaxID=2049346 RepID=A0ABQ9X519_9EUKA|nr:hypothetical protein BLNAU_18250 [Blattamonas nauphoetae]